MSRQLNNAPQRTRVACVQINARNDVQANLDAVTKQLERAAEAQVDLVLLPENFAQMANSAGSRHCELWQPEQPDSSVPVQRFLKSAAAQYSLMIVAGSMPIKPHTDAAQPFSRCIVVDERGQFIAHYDKLHLFDVNTEQAQYRESDDFAAGALAQVDAEPPSNVLRVSTGTDGYKLGLTICYDLRFPELFRRMLNAGAQVFTIPAAFTYETGRRHWQILLQARAIENQSYVIAAGQCGEHPTTASLQGKAPPRRTWGHSMVIAPSGDIIASLGHDEDLLIADIDLTQQQIGITQFPAIHHQRLS